MLLTDRLVVFVKTKSYSEEIKIISGVWDRMILQAVIVLRYFIR